MSASSKKKLRKEQAAEQITEKQLQEQKEAKKLKTYTVTFAVVMILVVCFAVGTFTTQMISNSGIMQKYTTAVTIGDQDVSSAFLNYFYIDGITNTYANWESNYGDYTNYFLQMMYGLDLTKPLNEQSYDVEDKMTWADYFANLAVTDAQSVYTMYDLAVKAGHTLTDEEKETLEANIENTEFYAMLYYGYTDLESYLKATYGNASSEESFRKYKEMGTLATSYYNAYSDSLTYTDADLKKYSDEHFNEFSSYSYSSFLMGVSDFLTGGTKGEDGKTTYSDEDQKKAQTAAAAAAENLKKAGITTRDAFDKALAAMDVYKDNKSITSSKNEDVAYSNITKKVAEWVSDPARKAGEFTVIANESTSKDADGKEVKTITGYYLVLFEGRNDNNFALKNVRHILSAFEGGTTNSSGETVYSETDKKKAKDAAEKLLSDWKAGDATEDSFAALVKDNTDDGGSKNNGGLYEDIYPGQMVTEFEDWCYDKTRKAGDTGIVETEYGYHVMYYVGESKITYRNFMIENELREADLAEWVEKSMEDYPTENIKTKYLDLDFIIAPNTGK